MERDVAITVTRVYSILTWLAAVLLLFGALGMAFVMPFVARGMMSAPIAFPTCMPSTVFTSLATGMGLFMGVLLFGAALFFAATGAGLWRRDGWARYAMIALSVVWLLAFPLGTLVGAFGIYAFAFDKNVAQVFGVRVAVRETTRAKPAKKTKKRR